MKHQRAVVLAIALFVAAAPIAGTAEVIERVLVKVNGDIITKTDLEQRQIDALRRSRPDALKSEAALKEALAEVTPQVLVEAIDSLLMLQLGRERNLRLTDEMFNRWLTSMRKEQGLTDDETFNAALKQEGLTLADLRRNVERQFIIEEIRRSEVGSKLQITEEEARQYYLLHQREFVEPAAVTLREILIEGPENLEGEARAAAALESAREVLARVKGGEDFGKVAQEVSSAASKANGGLIGPIPIRELSQNLQDLLAKMQPGDVTEPLRSTRGYQLIKLETRTEDTVQPFESVRDIVADRVFSARQRTEMQKFLNRLRAQAIIEWKNEELKQAYERQVVRLSGSQGN